MKKNVKRIFIAGHNGMVGSAIARQLSTSKNIEIISRTSKELDLTNQQKVFEFFQIEKIDQVYLAAAKVGGIVANNSYPAEFIYKNLMIQSNIIHAAYTSGVNKLLFLGSSCIYPKLATQPMSESELLTGILEPTNEPYAIAKIAGIKMCESYNRQYGVDYRSVMPTNLYGPGDNFHPENSHVIPGLIRRIHEAKINNQDEVVVWGSGKVLREFLFVDDMAEACVHVSNIEKEKYDALTDERLSHINIGYGSDISISEVAQSISRVIKFKGKIRQDITKPDGAPRKLMSSLKVNELGWTPKYNLESGLEIAYDWFKKNIEV